MVHTRSVVLISVHVASLTSADRAAVRTRNSNAIAARVGQHAVGEGLLAGFGERDECGGAESELPASAADDEPLDPASGSGGLNEEVQAVAVGVLSRRSRTDEGGREGLVRLGQREDE